MRQAEKWIAVVVVVVVAGLLGPVTAQTTKPAPPSGDAVAAVRGVIKSQADAWNAGDVGGYMEGYAKEPSTTFVGSNKVTRGWQTVLDRYKTKYDTREKMGTLVFSDVEVTQLDDSHIMAIGQWQLTPKGGEVVQGRFTLLFRRTTAGWRIVYDHSS